MITRVSVYRLVLVSLLTAFVVWGCCDTDYNAILNIGPGAGTGKCPNGVTDAALGCSLSPNPVPTDHLDIYVNTTLLSSSLDIYKLIIGIPLPAGASASLPQIDKIMVYNPAGNSHRARTTPSPIFRPNPAEPSARAKPAPTTSAYLRIQMAPPTASGTVLALGPGPTQPSASTRPASPSITTIFRVLKTPSTMGSTTSSSPAICP